MKIVINPAYQTLYSFVENAPSIFDEEGMLIYRARNLLKTFHVGGYDLIIKSFKKPLFFNRIVYTFFRRSKARRSYEHALRLLEKEVPTPKPVAFIEEKTCGLLNRSYYISIFEKRMDHIRPYMSGEIKDNVLIGELAEFIADFHAKGVHFMDISPGNILQKKEQGKFRFSLVDINRMKFQSIIPPEKRYKSFKRISNQPEIILSLAREYAQYSQLDEEKTVTGIQKACNRFFNIS